MKDETLPSGTTEWTALANAVGRSDYFSLLQAPRQFDIDDAELRRQFLTLNRRLHPDALAGESDDAQALGMQIVAQINAAYETLRDPVKRAEYLLELGGGKTAAQDKRVPPEALNQTLMLREEIEEARAADDPATLATIRENVLQQKAASETRIANLARRIAANPTDADRDELRLQLNAMKYVQNLLSQF